MNIIDEFTALSEIGATSGGGMHRLCATSIDGVARDWLRGRLEAAGARVHVDEIGNVFGLFEFVPSAPYVLTGSHIDSQPTGGKYDGAYGVVASLVAAAGIAEGVHRGEIVPRRNLAVVAWTNEEGARFQPSLMGSSVFTGALALDKALLVTDPAGISVGEALEAIGYRGIAPLDVPIEAYAEIHVEQSSSLERNGIDVAAVTASWAAYKYNLEILGEQSHTGATPMAERRDALLGAALVIAGVRTMTDSRPEGLLHSSVTELRTYPESPNVVTSHATMHVEIRSADYDALAPAEAEFLELIESAATAASVDIKIQQLWHREPARYWEPSERISHAAAARADLSSMSLLTVSGHDSIALNKIAPTVMLFVPSAGGYAHSEREFTEPDDLCNGVKLLHEVLVDLLFGDLDRTGYDTDPYRAT
ncbi:M20 family metallo-hydrolase [Arthrobacter sp. U41]|uniref:M20 family metallo-hydrolase n=1 Tax=Arthrobacter sp. U41 TaxID=1849032 RepID=UPI0008593DE1|nr:M20 family metallo-hydrolase [Arthrobacter sp. U41]AOT05809.1 hypothetical protein ASPU41_20460 [Arthrobacter sp. U41]